MLAVCRLCAYLARKETYGLDGGLTDDWDGIHESRLLCKKVAIVSKPRDPPRIQLKITD